jgi:plasmid stabilization system protein ParE
MALKIRLTVQALRDLQQIRAYLIVRSPKGAERVRREIERTIASLGEHPGIGHSTRIGGLRVITTRRYPYLVYHRATDAELTVVHIRHGVRASPAPEDLR